MRIILLYLITLSVFAGTGAIPSGDNIKLLKDNLRFKNTDTKIMTNDSDDPTSVAKSAEIGSLYIKSDDGIIYRKTDSGSSTNWVSFVGITGTGTDNCLARWDGTGSILLQDSVVCITDAGVVSGITQLNVDNLRVDGNVVSSTDTNGDIVLTPDGTGEVEVSSALVVQGNFTVNGTTTTVNSTTLDVADQQITVNKDGNQASANLNDAGILVEMSDATDVGITYDSTVNSRFRVGDIGTQSEIVTVDDSQDLLNKTQLQVDDITIDQDTITSDGNIVLDPDPTGAVQITNQTTDQPLYLDSSGNIVTQDISLTADVSGVLPPSNGGTGLDGSSAASGEVLIGNGSGYTLSTISGTTDQISVTNGAGSITLSTPQDIDTAAVPEFSGLTLSGLNANEFVITDGSSSLSTTTTIPLDDVSGTLAIANGGTNATSFTQDSIVFMGATGLSEDNANFNFDDSTDTLGLTGVLTVDNLTFDGSEISSTDNVEVANDLLMTGNGQIGVPVGTTAQRSGTPTSGIIRFNSDLGYSEIYNGNAWKRLDDTKDIDRFFQEDFEGAAVSFTCDANIAAADDTGLMGSDTSKSFTQSTGAQDEVCSSANIPFAGAQEAKLCLVSSGSTNFDLKVYDVTNSTYLGTAPLRGNSNQDCVWFEGESSTVNIRYDLVVRIEENADELIIDNVQAKYFPFETGDVWGKSNEIAVSTFSSFGGSGANSIFLFSTTDNSLGDAITYDSGAGTFTANEDGIYEMSASAPLGATGLSIGILRNSSTFGYGPEMLDFAEATASADQVNVSSTKYLESGDVIRLMQNASTSPSIAARVRFKITKVGYKKSVTVKNTTSSDIASENEFSVKVSSAGVASDPNIEGWYDSVSKTATGLYSIDVTGMSLSSPMNCQSQVNSPSSFGNVADCDIDKLATTSTEIVIRCHNDGGTGAATDEDFTLNCQKAEPDFVKERDRVYTFAADSLTGNYVRAEGNGGTSITSTTTDVDFTEVVDTAGAWDGDSYTVQKNNSKITISGYIFATAGQSDYVTELYKNGTLYKQIGREVSSGSSTMSFSYHSSRGEFVVDDVLSIRLSNNLTLQNNSAFHYLNISEEYGDRGTFVGQFGQPTCFYRVNTPGNVSYSSEPGSTSYTQNNINRQEGSCDFSSVASDQITLKKGTYNYRIPIGAVDNTAYVDVRLFDGTTTLKEHLDLIYSGAVNAIFSNEARGQVTLNTDTTLRVDTRAGNNSGTMYLFDFEITKVR